jgi:hypothetical protein
MHVQTCIVCDEHWARVYDVHCYAVHADVVEHCRIELVAVGNISEIVRGEEFALLAQSRMRTVEIPHLCSLDP